MLRRVSPMALDFHEVSVVPVSEHLAFITSGQQYTWPGVGGLTRINTELLWTHERFSLSGGAFGGRYFTSFNPSPEIYGWLQCNGQLRPDGLDDSQGMGAIHLL